MTWHTTGSLARLLGLSRDQIIADLATLRIRPVRDATGRRLLTGSHVQRILRLHQVRARRRGGSEESGPGRRAVPGAP